MKRYIMILCALVGITAVYFRDIPEVVTASANLNNHMCRLVIDPGHGGEDGGAVGVNEVLEKDINLGISLILADMFENAGYEVVLTRDGDYSIGNHELDTIAERKASDIKKRTEICNSSDAELVISIHQNYFEQEKYYGVQVFYGTEDSSELLAQEIQLRIREDIQPENRREIKPGGESIYLLNNVTIPAVIVECGFLSNANEAELLCQENYQKKMAYSIFLGTMEYLGH